jgi:hypothetical protein
LREEATKSGRTTGRGLLGALVLLFVLAGFLAGSARAADSVSWSGGKDLKQSTTIVLEQR